MKKALIIISLLFCGALPSQGQSWAEFISTVEQNNLTIKSLRQAAEARKLENRSEKLLADPTVEFGYMWRTPSSIGNKHSFSVRQGVDISTLTGAKSRLVKALNVETESAFRAHRIEVLLEVERVAIELYYYETVVSHLKMQLDNAKLLETGYAQRYESGDISKMEYNAVRSNLLKVTTDYSNACIERNALRKRLEVLNGGKAISVVEPSLQLPQNFDAWIEGAAQKNPALENAIAQLESARRRLSVNRTNQLPSLNVGYAHESGGVEKANGVVVGVSVPLWSGRNRVKQSKAVIESVKADVQQMELDVVARLRAIYERASSLEQLAREAESEITAADELNLLRKAVEAGEISVGEYISMAHVQYDLLRQKEELWRDYRFAAAELLAVEL